MSVKSETKTQEIVTVQLKDGRTMVFRFKPDLNRNYGNNPAYQLTQALDHIDTIEITETKMEVVSLREFDQHTG